MRCCELCGFDISYRHGLAKYCWFCSEIIKKIQTTVSQMKRGTRAVYMRWYNKYRRKGSMMIGEHRQIDFAKEYQIVHREKLNILSRGVSYFN